MTMVQSTPPAKYDWGWIEFADSSDDDASFSRALFSSLQW